MVMWRIEVYLDGDVTEFAHVWPLHVEYLAGSSSKAVVACQTFTQLSLLHCLCAAMHCNEYLEAGNFVKYWNNNPEISLKQNL